MTNTGYFDWKAGYDRFHDGFPGFREQPVIGITGNFGEKGCELAEGYYESVLRIVTPWRGCWNMWMRSCFPGAAT